jgi:membrane-bound ClpP family serine protease
MWILKNSKDLLDNLKSRSFSQVSSIKTLDFSTLYTTLPHDKLKTRLKETIHNLSLYGVLWSLGIQYK